MQRQTSMLVYLPGDVSTQLGAYAKQHKTNKASAVAGIVAEYLENFRADVAEGIS
jgi:hypothetical protein